MKHDCLRCLKLGVTVQPQPALLGCGPPDCSLLGVSGVWMEETVKKRVHRRRRKGLLTQDGKKWPPVAAGPFRVPCWEKCGSWKVELMLVILGLHSLQSPPCFADIVSFCSITVVAYYCRVKISRATYLELNLMLTFPMKLGTPGVCFLPVGHRTVSGFPWNETESKCGSNGS